MHPVDEWPSRVENFNMRRLLTILLLGGFLLPFLPVAILAQGVFPDYGRRQQSFNFPPASPRKCVEIGNFYLRRKDYRGALSRYKQAARENHYYAPAYLGLGKVYEKTGKKHRALDAYRKYLAMLPSERQANRATGVHKAIRRLEKELRRERRDTGTKTAGEK